MPSEGESNGQPEAPWLDFHQDPWGKLVLTTVDGRQYVGVEPVRGFPISDPRSAVALVDADGREVLWIDRLDDLPPGPRRVLEDELARREFMPVLRRILKVTPVEPSEWEVETDRGRTQFVLNHEDDVRRLGEHRAMVIDAHGIRYLIPDVRQLDATSRRLVEKYL